jgi:transcriptional regulator with XRE-family HTH domain
MGEGDSLRQICRENGMAKSTVRQWVRDDRAGFAAQYHAARALQVEAWSHQIVEIANREDLDPHDKRVRVDTLKWLMSKLAPRRYGERLLVAGEAESPLHVIDRQVSLDSLTDEQLEALERFTTALMQEKRE